MAGVWIWERETRASRVEKMLATVLDVRVCLVKDFTDMRTLMNGVHLDIGS